MPKLCPKCNRILDEDCFHWKFKNKKRAVYCVECSRAYIRAHYWKNKQYYLDKVKLRNSILLLACHKYLASFLISHPCVDCGEKDPVVLEFDHKDRLFKRGEVSKLIKQRLSLKVIAEEVSKCEVRCANCHRRKTARETGSWKLKYAPVA